MFSPFCSTTKAFTATWTVDQQQPPCTTRTQDIVRQDCRDCRPTTRHTWATLLQRRRQTRWACTDITRATEAPPATSRPSPTTWWAQYQRSTNVIKTPFMGMYTHDCLTIHFLRSERASANITLHVEETAVERRIMQIHVFAVVAMTEQQQQQHNTQLQQCNWYLLVHLLAHSADRVAGRLKNYHYYY